MQFAIEVKYLSTVNKTKKKNEDLPKIARKTKTVGTHSEAHTIPYKECRLETDKYTSSGVTINCIRFSPLRKIADKNGCLFSFFDTWNSNFQFKICT